MNQLKVKLLSENAQLPTKAHKTDSGFDLYAAEDVLIAPGETKVIKTDIAIVLPDGYEAQVRPRSGITSKTKLRVQLGTIDNAYRGNIGVIIDNISIDWVETGTFWTRFYALVNGNHEPCSIDRVQTGTYKICKGDKIAQLVVQALPQFEAIQVDELVETERGSNGFGSSGV